MKKKVECRMHTDGDDFYRYMDIIGKAGTKFKLDRGFLLGVVDKLLAIRREEEANGKKQNSRYVISKAIEVLRNEMSEFIEFKEYDEKSDRWKEA